MLKIMKRHVKKYLFLKKSEENTHELRNRTELKIQIINFVCNRLECLSYLRSKILEMLSLDFKLLPLT